MPDAAGFVRSLAQFATKWLLRELNTQSTVDASQREDLAMQHRNYQNRHPWLPWQYSTVQYKRQKTVVLIHHIQAIYFKPLASPRLSSLPASKTQQRRQIEAIMIDVTRPGPWSLLGQNCKGVQ